MKKIDKTMQLIGTMNRSEKRYFKLFSARYSWKKKHNYVRLFEALDHEKEFDEKPFREKYKKEPFIRNLPFERTHLHQQLLRVLSIYWHEESNDIVLRNLLTQAEILYRKSLFEQAEKVLTKAELLARNLEKDIFLQEIFSFRRKLGKFNSVLGNLEKSIDWLENEEKSANSRLKSLAAEKLYVLFFMLQSRHGSHPVGKGKLELKRITRQLSSWSNPDTFTAIYHISVSWFLKYRNEDKLNEAENVILDLTSYIEKNPQMIIEYPYKYLGALMRLNIIQLQLGKGQSKVLVNYRKILQFKIKYGKLLPARYMERAIIDSNLQMAEHSRVIGDYKDALHYIDKILEIKPIDHPDLIAGFKIQLYHMQALNYFSDGEYSNSLKWFNLSFTNEQELRYDLQGYLRVVYLMLHYDMNNIDQLEYYTRSVYRYLLKRERLNSFEKTVLKFISVKMPRLAKHHQQIEAFKNLREELRHIFQNPTERKVLYYYDFVSWLDSKIEGVSFREVVKKKVAISYKTYWIKRIVK